jgi:hypothetical protein
MTRKMILVAFLCIAGLPFSGVLVVAVVDAILGDWTGMMFMGAMLWAVLVLKMAIALAWPDGKPDSAVEE